MPAPQQDFMHAAVHAALEMLAKYDHHLLHADCSERSVTHQLAVHLAKRFPDYQVDCEYNRDGFDVKKLQLPERRAEIADDALDAVTVFPDIIVHIRGTQDKNLLVVEVKKASSTGNHKYDLQKLAAFKSQMGYEYAVHIIVGYGRDGIPIKRQAWQ